MKSGGRSLAAKASAGVPAFLNCVNHSFLQVSQAEQTGRPT